MDNTTQPANELGTDQTATSETTNTENAITEEVKIASLFTKISEVFNEQNGLNEITEALETSQGVLVKNIVFDKNDVSSSMAFIPAVKIVELHDGSLTIK